jgi:DNA-directed RNA polymerase specialized sigma24 family protein
MNHLDEQDADLVARIAAGDKEAFREIHSRYGRNIDGFVRVRANNREDAEDIVQDTWEALWEKAKTYDKNRAAVSTFLRMLGVTAIANFYRRNAQRVSKAAVPVEGESSENLLSILRSGPDGMNHVLEDLMLKLVFGGSSPPHQMLVFGFVERLEWRPRELVSELSPRMLHDLEAKLETDYAATSALNGDTIRARFQLLRHSMLQPLMEVLTEPKTKVICRDFLTLKAGETLLNQYFTHVPNEISQWCLAVRRRVASELVQRAHDKGLSISTTACENSGQGP